MNFGPFFVCYVEMTLEEYRDYRQKMNASILAANEVSKLEESKRIATIEAFDHATQEVCWAHREELFAVGYSEARGDAIGLRPSMVSHRVMITYVPGQIQIFEPGMNEKSFEDRMP